MKTKRHLLIAAAALLALVFLIGRWTAPAHRPAAHQHGPEAHAAAAAPETWTCSMHPQIQQPRPGDCPICGMDLIALETDPSDPGPRALSMSESSRALADIETTEVERRFPTAEIRLVGKLEYDETKVKSLTARFPARIDELFVNFTGVPVQKGDHLARVYSPELLTAQSELLTAHRFAPDGAATRAAREKLLLWDLLPEQVEAIIRSGEASDTFELKAPIAGVVVSKKVNEGDYIQTGQSLFRIVDLDTLWLELNAYESDLAWLRFGQEVTFTVEAFPGQTFQGQITFIEPEISRETRTVSVRVNVDNRARKLKPGMFAKALVRSQVAKAGNVYEPEFAGKWISPMHPEIVKDGPGSCDICGMDLVPAEDLGYVQDPDAEPPLVVPASAVLRTGKRAVVYVELPNTERPTYQGREIEIGSRAGDVFIVQSGLQEGENVVTNGAFKIDSALQIKAKPSMMNPQGGPTTAEHRHQTEETSAAADPEPELAIEPALAAEIVDEYLALQAALAADDLPEAKAAARAMMASTGHTGALPALLHEMLASPTLDALRRPHFETLSNAFIAAVQAEPDAFDRALVAMHCPMVYPNRGADWLQNEGPLRNPYFGASMLTCGEVKVRFGDADNKGTSE